MDSKTPDLFIPSPIPFYKLAPHEVQLCVAIGERLSKVLRDLMLSERSLTIEVHPQIVAMDVAVAHLARNLDLNSFLNANVFDLVNEYINIHANIDRACGSFPVYVPLKFAQGRASLN